MVAHLAIYVETRGIQYFAVMALLSMKIIIGVYLILQLTVGGFLLAIDIEKGWLAVHTVFALIASSFYLAVHIRNPGFLKTKESSEQENEDSQQEKQEKVQGQEEPPNTEGNIMRPQSLRKKIPKPEKLAQEIEPAEGRLESAKNQQEKRFCRLCKIDQPLRSKHCYDCERCVATFDHHCPWMDNCIGEKNRGVFLLYLVTQACQILFVLIAIALYASAGPKVQSDYVALLLGLFLLFCLMCGLLGFHIYLMLLNLTTWEFLKWEQIPYLSSLQKKSSPFSKGLIHNTKQFWQTTFKKDYNVWELSQEKPQQQKE